MLNRSGLSIRLAALSHLQSLYVFTHDSFWVGEDGPTHQPVETCSGLRVIPGLDVVRPGDPEEVAGAMIAASIAAGSIRAVSGSTSAKTMLPPACVIASVVAMNVNGVVITSSPGPIPRLSISRCNAAVPLLTATA